MPANDPQRKPLGPPEWVEVEGFKALRDRARIEFRPLTVLAGANSSGKSSAMQPFLMLKQTLEASFDPGPLLLNGTHVRFTQLDQFLSRGERAFSVALGPIDVAVPKWSLDDVARQPSPAVRLTFEKEGDRLEPAVSQWLDGEWVSFQSSMDRDEFLRALRRWDQKRADWIEALPGDAPLRVTFDRFSPSVTALAQKPGTAGIWPVNPHYRWLLCLLHLPGLRGHRERRYEIANVGRDNGWLRAPGPFTPYVASVLAAWLDEDDDRLLQVNGWLDRLGLTAEVKAQRTTAADIALRVRRSGSELEDWVDIADVGIGVSQVMPVVVALTAAQPDQVVYIEQPELHLHPRAQYQMGFLLAEAAERGVRVVVETHSKLILRAIQTRIASPEGLRSDQVGLHWFTRDPDTGFATVELAEVDENGGFGEWPVDFSEVEAEANERWLDTAFGKASK